VYIQNIYELRIVDKVKFVKLKFFEKSVDSL